MILVDTHCHIHSADYPLDPDEVIARATAVGVTRLLCVGTTAEDSELAVAFVQPRPECWATIGLHPHDAKLGQEAFAKLAALCHSERTIPEHSYHPAYPRHPVYHSHPELVSGSRGVSGEILNQVQDDTKPVHDDTINPPNDTVKLQDHTNTVRQKKIVAIGECGLDYFYTHSSKEEQVTALRFQMELAIKYDLPMIFHVREAFDDFWPIFDEYPGLRGVVHSFTDTQENLQKALDRDLFIGVNGIATFTKNDWQLAMYKQIPLEKIVLETDAPFLTPTPLRGRVNESAHVSLVCKFLAALRQESAEELSAHATQNAITLFQL